MKKGIKGNVCPKCEQGDYWKVNYRLQGREWECGYCQYTYFSQSKSKKKEEEVKEN